MSATPFTGSASAPPQAQLFCSSLALQRHSLCCTKITNLLPAVNPPNAHPTPRRPLTPPAATPMSHSRTVSPLPNGRWNAPGLNERGSTPNSLYSGVNNYHNNDDQWAAAKARSAQVRGYPSIQTKNEGFFLRSKRKISALPVFSPYTPLSANWKDPEKLGRSRWYPRGGGSLSRIKTFAGNVLRRFKFLFIILSIVTLTTFLMSQTRECHMQELVMSASYSIN